MDSSVESLTTNQYEVFKQFKSNIQDVVPDDFSDAWIIKWLKAYNFNIAKTERNFRGIMAARQVYKLDEILNTYVKPEAVVKHEYTSFVGFAKNNSLIRYIRAGDGDHLGFLMSLSGYDIPLYCSYVAEWDMALMKKESERIGKEINEITYVLDLEGFQIQNIMHKCFIEVGLDLVQMVQDHYPEIWGNILIVNAPVYFDKIFNIFKPILGLSILQKLRVAAKDSSPSLLLKYIDADVLPEFLGGKRVDSRGDPRCSEFIKFGGKVPEEYYLSNRKLIMPEDPGVISVWVSPRSVYNHSFVVREPNSKLHIEMRSENGSLGLKMMYRPFGDDPENVEFPATDEYLDDSDPKSNVKFVSPYARSQSHMAPVDNECYLPWLGIYIYRFDNTYSWFTSKRLIFRMKVMKP